MSTTPALSIVPDAPDAIAKLATMLGGVEYNHRMSMWVAHAPSGTVHENGSPGLLHAFEDTVEDAIANVFAKWREAGAPAWPRGAVSR